MKTILALVLTIVGCASASIAHARQNGGLIKAQYITIANVQRSYDLYVPQMLTREPSPLVLLFHGHGGNSDVMTGENHKAAPYKVWLSLAEDYHFIVAIPNGTAGKDGRLGWNDCRMDADSNPASDDVLFVKTLIQRLNQDYAIDPARIYATGTSNGGHMVLRLAMEMSDTFAAVAPVVAAMPVRSKCTSPGHPISVMFMNGTKDPLSPYEGGRIGKDKFQRGEVLSTAASVGYWIDHNGTSSLPLLIDLPNRSRRDGSHVLRALYSGGKQDTEVVLYKVVGGGHTEPSLKEKYGVIYRLIVGDQNHDIEMANEVWAFFKNKRR